MVRYVTIKKFCELSGYTSAAVYHKKYKGVWREGEVWVHAPDGHIMIDLEGFNRWVESEKTPSPSRIGGPLPSPTLPRLKGGRSTPELPPDERRPRSPQLPQLEPPEQRSRRGPKTA
jgi:hypothetical protein